MISAQLCVWPPFFKNRPRGGGFGGEDEVNDGGGLNGSFLKASTFGLPGFTPTPPMVICLFFKGLPNFGEHGAESDPLRCLGGTLGGTITELTFMAEVESDKECNEVLDDDEATTFDLVSNGFHEFSRLSGDSSFSVIY